MQRLVTQSYSLVIPVYKNEGSIESLLNALEGVSSSLHGMLEVIFVVDGSPDRCFEKLALALPSQIFKSKLILLSRNFGSFAAIRCGLEQAGGEYIGVMAADLQEPPSLMLEFFGSLSGGNLDVVFGRRTGRSDPGLSKISSNIFWGAYRKFVQPDVPPGGVDVFALTAPFRDRLLSLGEANSSLLGLLFWLGGRREFIEYKRQERQHGKSAWTTKKKITYLLDSVFAFSDLPVRLLMSLGFVGMSMAFLVGIVILCFRIFGGIQVPGYAGSMLAILFFGALNTFGIGIVGNYAWRSYENTKQRPLSVISHVVDFSGKTS